MEDLLFLGRARVAWTCTKQAVYHGIQLRVLPRHRDINGTRWLTWASCLLLDHNDRILKILPTSLLSTANPRVLLDLEPSTRYQYIVATRQRIFPAYEAVALLRSLHREFHSLTAGKKASDLFDRLYLGSSSSHHEQQTTPISGSCCGRNTPLVQAHVALEEALGCRLSHLAIQSVSCAYSIIADYAGVSPG